MLLDVLVDVEVEDVELDVEVVEDEDVVVDEELVVDDVVVVIVLPTLLQPFIFSTPPILLNEAFIARST